MIFELLPNEILIELFEYLNAFEIFHSFDQLNIRFYNLIRNISLHLNFQHVRKAVFDQFCAIIISNPMIKKQIYSLKLSNKDTCGQIDLFLSYFSFEEFSDLRSLTLIRIEQNNVDKLKTMLPLLINLQSLHLIRLSDQKNEGIEILPILPINNLRILSIPTLPSLWTHTNEIPVITHLTIFGCSLDQLFDQVFKYAPLLKYLSVQNIHKSSHSIKKNPCAHRYYANYLTQLIIENYECIFEEFEVFVQLTPRLKRLTISSFDNNSMIEADQWEQLITSSLQSLKHFQFIFGLYCKGTIRDNIMDKFKLFQSDYWCNQHHWYTECVLDIKSAVIYTTPYISNTYRLTPSIEYYSHNYRKFDHVTDLILCCQAAVDNQQYYFSNVQSLKLQSTIINTMQNDEHILKPEHLRALQKSVNLRNLKHLDIGVYYTIKTSLLVEIFSKAPHLSSLTINPIFLSILINEDELCYYLKKMIKQLNISKSNSNAFNNTNEIERFCKIFSNLEQLTCSMNQLEQFLILTHQSPKLSIIKLFITSSHNSDQILSDFKNEALNSNSIYRLQCFRTCADGSGELYETELCIWTSGRRS